MGTTIPAAVATERRLVEIVCDLAEQQARMVSLHDRLHHVARQHIDDSDSHGERLAALERLRSSAVRA